MVLVLLAGSGNPKLMEAVAARLGISLAGCVVSRFPDGELQVSVDPGARGGDAYVLQPTGPPVDENLIELLMLADACRRAGAARVTAIVPYLGYARQDRRTIPGGALGLRVVGNLIRAAVDRLVVVDPHTPAVEAAIGIPVESLTAVPILAEALSRPEREEAVIVAPDAGAIKLAERYAALLRAPVAVIHKRRVSGEAVRVLDVAGEVRDRVPIIIDDMISTGATIEAAIGALVERGCRTPISVAATHGLFAGGALDRLSRLPVERIVVSDTLAIAPDRAGRIEVVSIAPLLANAVARLHRDESLGGLSAFD